MDPLEQDFQEMFSTLVSEVGSGQTLRLQDGYEPRYPGLDEGWPKARILEWFEEDFPTKLSSHTSVNLL